MTTFFHYFSIILYSCLFFFDICKYFFVFLTYFMYFCVNNKNYSIFYIYETSSAKNNKRNA